MKMLLLTAVVGASALLTGCHEVGVAVHGQGGYGYGHGYGYGPSYYGSYRRPYYARSYPYYGRSYYRGGRYYGYNQGYNQPYYGNRTYYRTSSRAYYPGDGVRYATRRVVSAPRRVVHAVVD